MDKIQKAIKIGIEEGLKSIYNNKLDNKIHVHQLFEFCTRRKILALKNNTDYAPALFADTGTLFTRAIGVKVEEIIAELLKSVFKNKIIHKYKLKLNVIDTIDITGEIDIVCGKHIVEVKSMKPESFDDELPLNYIYQVQSYMALGKLSQTKLDTNNAYIITVCKLQKKEPYKIHKISYNKECENNILGIIEDIRGYFNNKIMPKRICNSLHCYTAKKCHLRNICFKEE